MRQKKIPSYLRIYLTVIAFVFFSCTPKAYPPAKKTKNNTSALMTKSANKPKTEIELIKEAEEKASKEGRDILETGRKMALDEKVIIKGSCWNWVNECFKRAGYEKEKYVFYKSKKSGPYVDISKIESGDWVYYINHSYNGIEHSGIFVYWIDYKKKTGMILSYGGESRKEPGRYLPYDLSNVYYITRAGKK